MIELTLEELKATEMRIMDYVDAFCRENGINYSLDGGTLLGAVRHKGFIPWDDDIDILMTRDEYNRFTEKWKSISNHPFVFSNEEIGNSYGYPFGKVHDPQTVTFVGPIERTGVFIDVFPIDKVVDRIDFETRRKTILELHKKRGAAFDWLQVKNGGSMFRKRVKTFFNRPHKDFYQYASMINDIAKSKNSISASWCYDLVSPVSAKSLTPAKTFDAYRDIPFEDRTYRAMADYDTYLTCLYGDYMTPPPPEKRVTHHGFKAYWK